MERIYLNYNWNYTGKDNKEIVDLPHTNIELPYNYFDEQLYQFTSIYEKELFIDNNYKGKHLFLTFEGVLHQSQIYINNNLLLTHNCGYDAFTIDITNHVNYGENNNLKVVVNSSEDLNIPPFGRVVDYLTYGGIYRDVYLDIKGDNYLEDSFVYTINEGDRYIPKLDLTTNLDNTLVMIKVYDQDNQVYNNEIIVNKKATISLDFKPILWDIDNPHRYKLVLTTSGDEKIIYFGVRVVEFKADGFYLNKKLIKLIGLNRHQSYPYVGYAMPESMQRYDAKILKEELGVNAVRLSHYMQSQYFLDECDKLGLLVFIETPGWQYLGDEEWKQQVIENVKNMVLQNRNHPSIILWGARINESIDCHDLYQKTNDLIHSLDPTRLTGGVRCYTKGEELEDVYTYNDFSNPKEKRALLKKKDVVTNINIPYFISEFNGHMYPTKAYDDETHRQNQMLRYARIYDLVMEEKEILGAFGWCMFDYNTHKDFGSGDKICYHGVMDMYRNPKLAAHFYHTMNIDDNTLILSSNLKPGDHPASSIEGLYALTSADSVKLYRNDEFIREYTHQDSPYKHLKNAPILINDFVGNLLVEKEGYSKKVSEDMKAVLYATLKDGSKIKLKYKLKYLKLMLFHHINYEKGYELYGKYLGNWGSRHAYYKFEAIKNNKIVNTVILSDSTKQHLEIIPSSNELINKNTYDVVSIRVRMKDENNQLLYYLNEACELSVEGPIEIIGPKLLQLRGGMGGTYLKSKPVKEPVNASLKIKYQDKEEIINFIVK